MAATARTKAFMHGGSQAVRIPKEFRLPGKEMRIEKRGRGVYIEPVEIDLEEFWARIDRDFPEDFMKDGRQQPSMPPIKTWDP